MYIYPLLHSPVIFATRFLHNFHCRFRQDTDTQQFAVSSFCHLEYSFEFDCNLAISICIPINHFQVEPLCWPPFFPIYEYSFVCVFMWVRVCWWMFCLLGLQFQLILQIANKFSKQQTNAKRNNPVKGILWSLFSWRFHINIMFSVDLDFI